MVCASSREEGSCHRSLPCQTRSLLGWQRALVCDQVVYPRAQICLCLLIWETTRSWKQWA
ncbi:hypothetical protein AG1IA_09704 [Rhizoctonia solani AG-1 IA]|uniref:Uncharacterized protein n=1 Tax=Thanatephorus cucumeris (strain AG1-IA) TaxID=983506 RepID=L8WEB5_THACA|nr:hypothetical protein AG1IA_09704 [Rhizoctonia solani AG-1 IA]